MSKIRMSEQRLQIKRLDILMVMSLIKGPKTLESEEETEENE